jgi:hypothetical protein
VDERLRRTRSRGCKFARVAPVALSFQCVKPDGTLGGVTVAELRGTRIYGSIDLGDRIEIPKKDQDWETGALLTSAVKKLTTDQTVSVPTKPRHYA